MVRPKLCAPSYLKLRPIIIIYSVLCSNKALLDAIPSLSDSVRPVISSETSIVLFQNGVGAEEPLHKAFPQNTIISAVVNNLLSGMVARIQS